MNKIVAFDFDNTLAVTDYPTIIEPKLKVIEFAKRCKKVGRIIILNTCRHGESLDEAIEFCRKFGLEFDYVNENVPELIAQYGNSRKIYADYYIDDKAVPVDYIDFLKV